MRRVSKLAIVVLAVLGCAGTKGILIGEEAIVERSASQRPEWTTSQSEEQDDYVYATGEMSHARERGFGMNQANADGVQKLLTLMRNRAVSDVSQDMRGNNVDPGDVARVSMFGVAWTSDIHAMTGVTTPMSYWEKVQRRTSSGVDYHYDCYVRLRMSRANYNKALESAYEDIARTARQENIAAAEEAARERLERLRSK